MRGDVLKRNRAYRQIVASQFSTVTPENEMKWELIEPSRGEYDFGPADDIVEHADEARQKVRGHTLVWHSQLPAWVRELGPKDLQQAMREHIRNVMEHYDKEVGVWDVVNEPIADSGRLRPSVFARRLGEGFIEDAFRTARAADADAKLYLNEIGAEGSNPKSDRLYEIVRGLKARGVPIDGVGFQSHFNLDGIPAGYVENMQRFRALGVDVAITEADVGLRLSPSAADLNKQARDLRPGRARLPDREVRVADVPGLHRRTLVDLRDAGRDGRRDAARRQAPAEAGVRRGAAGAARGMTGQARRRSGGRCVSCGHTRPALSSLLLASRWEQVGHQRWRTRRVGRAAGWGRNVRRLARDLGAGAALLAFAALLNGGLTGGDFATLAAGQPINHNPPALTGDQRLGGELTCGRGHWDDPDGAPYSVTYQWRRDGAELVGQTNPTYTVVSADIGARCVAT